MKKAKPKGGARAGAGRPPSPVRRKVFAIRATDAELAALRKLAAKLGMNAADWMRSLAHDEMRRGPR